MKAGMRSLAPMFLAVCCAGALFAADRPGSFAYVLQADALAKSRTAAVTKLAACERDWIVLDAVYSPEEPWTAADLDTIRKARPGRKVLAYLSIGEAENYRPYWKRTWTGTGAPAWLLGENPEWKGNFRVKYWHADWQRLMLEQVDAAMARGFDGVYLDIVDGFETFERKGRDFEDDRINPETRQSFRRDMVDWVKILAARTRTKRPDALVIPQNGAQLLAHADFVDAISGIGIEDLFTDGNAAQPRDHTDYVIDFLKRLHPSGKPVLVIEYPRNTSRQTLCRKGATERGYTLLLTDRDLKTLGQSP